MKNKLFLLLMLLLFTEVSQAQWQPDMRLTNNPSSSLTSPSNAWCVAASGDIVHVIWQDNRDGNDEIYYKRSTDGGLNWVTDTRLTNNSANSWRPSEAVYGSVVHVVWEDFRDGNQEVYYKRSSDGGLSWGTDTRLTNNSAASFYLSVSVYGQIVDVVWVDLRDGNQEIYYKRSADGGISWGADTRLTNNSADSHYPSISVSGQGVHVVWYDFRDGNAEIYYKRSTDNGISWGPDTRLTNNNAASYNNSIAVFGTLVNVVWLDTRDGNSEIYYKRSTDGGISWGTDTRLTYNTANSWLPSVSVSGLVVHVVWEDFRNGVNGEIYYKRSTDRGISWGLDTRLTNDPDLSAYASVSVSGSVVHIVWTDNRDGNTEIYYKRDPTGNPLGLINVNSEIPKEFSLSQNYPNPFNPVTHLRFEIPELRIVRIIIYDLLGREITTLVNEQLSPGTYEVEFDASNYPSGVYYYRIAIHSDKLSYGDYANTRKMVLIK